jgi:hypothetical protein
MLASYMWNISNIIQLDVRLVYIAPERHTKHIFHALIRRLLFMNRAYYCISSICRSSLLWYWYLISSNNFYFNFPDKISGKLWLSYHRQFLIGTLYICRTISLWRIVLKCLFIIIFPKVPPPFSCISNPFWLLCVFSFLVPKDLNYLLFNLLTFRVPDKSLFQEREKRT